jgi:hypothetical protein
VLCENGRIVDLTKSARVKAMLGVEDLRVHQPLPAVLGQSLASSELPLHLEASFGRQNLCHSVAEKFVSIFL